MSKKITCTFYVGEKKVDKLTDEQKEKMAERMGKAMSQYYTATPAEYEKI